MATFTSFPDIAGSTAAAQNERRAGARELLTNTLANIGTTTGLLETGAVEGERRLDTIVKLLSNLTPGRQASGGIGPLALGQNVSQPSQRGRRGISRQPSRGGVGATPQNLRAIRSSFDSISGAQSNDVRIVQEPLEEILDLATQIAAAGGTEEARQASADLARTRQSLQQTIEAFTPARAEQLAEGVVDDIFRRLREEIAPQINAVAEAGGASRGALRALLLQDAEARAGEAAARAVLEAIVGLGQLQTQAAGALASTAEVAPVSSELTRLIATAPTRPRLVDITEESSSATRSRSRGNAVRGLPIPEEFRNRSNRTRLV